MPFSSLLPSPLRLPTPFQPSISATSAYPHTSPLRCITGGSAARIALPHRLEVRALDAAQVFDYEGQASELLERRSKLKITVVGFSNFGQFLARTLAHQGHTLLAHSRSDHSEVARSLGVSFRDPHDLCEEHPDVVLLCTSILSTDVVLHSLPAECLHRNTLFVDVLSVKEFPKNLFLQLLPPQFNILCTHPMFGPESGKHAWWAMPSTARPVPKMSHKPCRARNFFLRSCLARPVY